LYQTTLNALTLTDNTTFQQSQLINSLVTILHWSAQMLQAAKKACNAQKLVLCSKSKQFVLETGCSALCHGFWLNHSFTKGRKIACKNR
jgi:hypothetical protein